MPYKLKTSQIKGAREDCILKQEGICAISSKPLHDPCYDHDHKTGMCRGVLNRAVNSALGRLENLERYGIKTDDVITFLENALIYLKYHRDNPSGIIHPTYRTPEEKRLLIIKRKKRKLNGKKKHAPHI